MIVECKDDEWNLRFSREEAASLRLLLEKVREAATYRSGRGWDAALFIETMIHNLPEKP